MKRREEKGEGEGGGEEVWGGEQIDYRLEQMAQQVREGRNLSFFHCKPHSVHFLAAWPLRLWEGADPGTGFILSLERARVDEFWPVMNCL